MSDEDWRFQTDDDYADRPSLSPVLAALASAGTIRDGARILDLGCGTGMDSVGLALALPRARVVGVDRRARALGYARERARVADVQARVEFRKGSALKLAGLGTFDVVVDTLLGNNLRALTPYARQLAGVTRKGALLVMTHKVEPGTDALPELTPHGPFGKAFRLGPQVATQLPIRTLAGRRAFVDVVVLVARRR